jgi:hypothetical protein
VRTVLILSIALATALAVPAEARTKRFGPHPHKSRVHTPRPHKLSAPKSPYRSVRIRRADGTVMTGYRDALGTHLHDPDGRTVHCQRQTFGAADINVDCR